MTAVLPVQRARNNLATISMIIGFLSATSFIFMEGIPFYIYFIFGLASIISGIISLKQVKDNQMSGKERAVAGITSGSIPIVITFIYVVMYSMI